MSIRRCTATALAAVAFGLLYLTLARAQELDKPVFVVALASQDGGHFARAVMVATPVSGGHVGVILNRPTELTLAKVFPEHAPSKAVKGPIYFGGPVSSNQLFAMVLGERASPKAQRLMSGVWLIPEADAIDRLIEKTPNAARYYVGIVYWRPGELAEEIAKGWMAVLPADPGKLFLPDTSKLYDEVVPAGRGRNLAVKLEHQQ